MTPDEETWRSVPGYEGYYEVSDHGRVRSVDRLSDNGRGAMRAVRGRLLAAHPNYGGRLIVALYRDGRCRCRKVHLLVLEAFVGPRPPGMVACHWDDNPLNNRLSNLRWDTESANHYDRVRNGRHPMAKRTHCPKGHELRTPNLVPNFLPRRSCRACSRAFGTRRRARAKGITVNFQAVADEHYARIMKE